MVLRKSWVVTALAVSLTAFIEGSIGSSGAQSDPAANPDSASVKWKLPSKLQGRVHRHVDDVPSFPMDDPVRMDPREWPTVTTILGAQCSLRVETGGYDVIWEVQSQSDVKPGASRSLHYEAASGDRVGPSYSWRGDGSLSDRYWKVGDSTDEYMYYKSGELYCYSYHTGSFERGDELFARNGSLVGFEMVLGGAGKTKEFISYWMGKKVDRKEFRQRRQEFLLRALELQIL